MNTDLIGLIAGVLTSFAMMPQLIKVIRTRNADDISILILIVLLSGLSLWVWYGIMKEDWQIILSNSFAVLVNLSHSKLSELAKVAVKFLCRSGQFIPPGLLYYFQKGI
ncbi:SemiSWEET transporter [Sphingobacterium thalpophilum]|uniref:SemiSWEET transporter n=1 Tax=Sphingobacterium thalpophilum TaxID=259 RepID=A0ACD5C809_9SPHI